MLALALSGTAGAAPARTGQLNAGSTSYKWTGPIGFGLVTFSDQAGLPGCGTPVLHDCDYTLLHVATPGKVTVKTSTTSPTTLDTSINIYASDASGTQGKPKANADSSSPNVDEQAAFTSDTPDAYWLVEINYLDVVGGDYNGEATLVPGEGIEATVAPTIAIKSPKKSVKASKFKSISGTASDDGSVTKVEVAVLSGKGAKCKSMTAKGSFTKAKCTAPKFLAAKGTSSWSLKLKKKLKKGTYAVLVKATDDTGNSSTARTSVKVK
jgi:Big-like domain-containing protein